MVSVVERVFVKKYRDKSKGEKIAIIALSLLFSCFLLLGHAFYKENSWEMIIANKELSIIAFVAMGIMLFSLIDTIWTKTDNHDLPTVNWIPKLKLVKKWYQKFEKTPGLVSFLTLLILYIPYYITFYPGIFMGDTPDIIAQGFNLPESTSGYLYLINPEITLNQHHPVIHTLFLHACIVAGHTLFQSWSIGIFLYSMIQAISFFAAYAYVIRTLDDLKISKKWQVLALLYFIISPRVQNYVFLISKDTFYIAFLLCYLCHLIFVIKGDFQKKQMIWLMAIGIGMITLRNDAKYLIVVSSIITACLCKQKTIKIVSLIMACSTICFSSIYGSILTNQFQLTSPSKREMLSVPFQQTARYVRDLPEEVTEEEKSSIKRILNYEDLADIYDPERSDTVKSTFNEQATTEDLKSYFYTWFTMFLKHPEIYIQATINNYYDYFYPFGRLAGRYTTAYSAENMGVVEQLCSSIDFTVSRNEPFHAVRTLLFESYDFLFYIPILSLMLTPAAYTWTLIFYYTYYMVKREKERVAFLTIFIISLLICLVGPCNGWYFRYLMPIHVCLPAAILFTQALPRRGCYDATN